MNLWVDPEDENVRRANQALQDFGSPQLLDVNDSQETLQLGVAPNRIDLLRDVVNLNFEDAWKKRIEGRYGEAPAMWIDIDSLIKIKSGIEHPRHQEDARILRAVRDRARRVSQRDQD
jgi:hypothetical protein